MAPDETIDVTEWSDGLEADLQTHHIAGFVPDFGELSVPLLTRVHPSLWMGGSPAPLTGNLRRVKQNPLAYFAAVFDLYCGDSYVVPAGVIHVRAKMNDWREERVPAERLELLADYVNRARLVGPTLVHCQAGLNRSGLLAALAMMKASGVSAREAIDYLRGCRHDLVLCNPTFEEWLLERGAG